MYKPLVVIVPTRSRPHNVVKVLTSWRETHAFNHADLIFAYDDDDPQAPAYKEAISGSGASSYRLPNWKKLVPKLNHVALIQAHLSWRVAVGFAGDDHIPRTDNWSGKYLETLQKLGTGMVYGNDLHHGKALPTEWAITTDIIRALGRFVPADVEHLYCDNSVLELGELTGTIRYLPEVIIEHMHPIWRKGEWDKQYQDVNSRQQYRSDGLRFNKWRRDERDRQAQLIRKLKEGTYDPDSDS